MSRLHFATRGSKAQRVIALLALSGCGPVAKPAQTPEAVVQQFARALSDGKPALAYGLLSSEYRQRVSLAQWQKQLEANPQEVSEASNQLAHLRGAALVHASMRQGDGTSIELVQEGGQWLIGSDVVEVYDQSTPRAALHSFVAAMQRKRYDVVLRLMPEADKEGVTTETMEHAFGHGSRDDIERMLSQLRPHLGDAIEQVGDHATLPYAEHHSVQFVKEGGSWRVASPR
jgi:hypothetical protein